VLVPLENESSDSALRLERLNCALKVQTKTPEPEQAMT
jgi:hypothetical protein